MAHAYKRPCHGGSCTEKGMAEPGFCKCQEDAETIGRLRRILHDWLRAHDHDSERMLDAVADRTSAELRR